MERPEIIEILIQSLHRPPESEQRVAYEFLREIAARRNEPFTRRSRAALHLAVYRSRRAAILVTDRVKQGVAAIVQVPGKAVRRAVSFWDSTLQARRPSRWPLLFALILIANGYFWPRDALVGLIGVTIGSVNRTRDTAINSFIDALRTIGGICAGTYYAVSALLIKALGAAKAARIRARDTLRTKTRLAVSAAYDGAVGIVVHSYTAIRNSILLCIVWISDSLLRVRAAVIHRYVRTRDALVFLAARISDRTLRSYRFVCLVCAEVRRQATRQVLPQNATPFVAASLVCLVLFVFGINSYFVISGVNRKAVFIDLSRYEWGDEALASMLIGEGYDIYLNEKITEKRIRELLASGRYYERVIRVTGYYSPLPDQEKYATGSYRGDIILNGRGIMGADTTPVYMGMAAGPPHLEYGTNVIIEDLGKFDLPKIYTVHDRGGAIKGNRLDIWVGKGEEAMKKAYEITGYYKVIVVGDK